MAVAAKAVAAQGVGADDENVLGPRRGLVAGDGADGLLVEPVAGGGEDDQRGERGAEGNGAVAHVHARLIDVVEQGHCQSDAREDLQQAGIDHALGRRREQAARPGKPAFQIAEVHEVRLLLHQAEDEEAIGQDRQQGDAQHAHPARAGPPLIPQAGRWIEQQDVANGDQGVAFEHDDVAPDQVPPVVADGDLGEAVVKAVGVACEAADGDDIPQEQSTQHRVDHEPENGQTGKGS